MKLGAWFALFQSAVPAGAVMTPSPGAPAQVEAEAEEEDENFAGSLSLRLDAQGNGDLTLWTGEGNHRAHRA